MSRAAPVLLVAALLAGCGPANASAAGLVVDIQATSLTQVDSFTLRTNAGELIVFRLGPVELGNGAFPPGHLREHMAVAQPVAVGYRVEDGQKVAYRLTDAPWLTP